MWWSRFAAPPRPAWVAGNQLLRLVPPPVATHDPERNALACSGLLLPTTNEVWLRFLDGRPVSAVTTQVLAWGGAETAARGKTALLLIWDNASWHISQAVRLLIDRLHNTEAIPERIVLPCSLVVRESTRQLGAAK